MPFPVMVYVPRLPANPLEPLMAQKPWLSLSLPIRLPHLLPTVDQKVMFDDLWECVHFVQAILIWITCDVCKGSGI